MIPLTIQGIGPVGAFGAGLNDLRAVLKGGKKVTPELTKIETDHGFHNLPVFLASSKALAKFVKSRELRRLDHFSRLALLGACLACEDAAQNLVGERTGLIVASAYGASGTTFSFLDSVIDDGDALASPTLFSNSVHNAAAAHIAKHLKITGPNLSLTQGHLSVPMALITAAHWLAEGRVDTVLCGAVDVYCDVLGYCWQCYLNQKSSITGSKHDFRPDPCGPGEGSLFFWLSRAEGESSPYGYFEKIELNSSPPDTVPFIYSSDVFHDDPELKRSQLKLSQFSNRLHLDISQLCGFSPITSAFDLAAAATMLYDQIIYTNNPLEHQQSAPFSESTIGCWQPDYTTSRKPLTGSCYWITNRLK